MTLKVFPSILSSPKPNIVYLQAHVFFSKSVIDNKNHVKFKMDVNTYECCRASS